MFKIILKRLAANDIDDIAAYIQQDNPLRAQSFTEEMSDKISVIAERPLSFPNRDDLSQGLRAALIGKYIILFSLNETEVHIIRVVHGARDVNSMF